MGLCFKKFEHSRILNLLKKVFCDSFSNTIQCKAVDKVNGLHFFSSVFHKKKTRRKECCRMYDVSLIAKYIIMRCNLQRYSISNLKLQKILYFVQAEFLVARGTPCFDAEIEAWNFGPVVPEVYRKYKIYGSASIPYVDSDEICGITHRDMDIINDMVNECGKYSASALVEITHRQDPWKKAYVPYYNNIISKDSIRRYFSED